MKTQIVRLSLFLLGLSAVGIGLSIIGLGPDKTVQFFARLIDMFGGANTPIPGFNSVNVDNEFRFYAIFWVTYGGFLIQTSRNLTKFGKRMPLLLGLFFLGGLGRILSYLSMGPPHMLFNILMIIELTLPVMIYFLWRSTKTT